MPTKKVEVSGLADAEMVVRMMDGPAGEPDPVVPPASRAPFNPKPYIMMIQGKEYLPVRARLLWMRYDHGSDWGIETDTVSCRDQIVTVRATIRDRTYVPSAASRNDYAEMDTMSTVATGLAEAPVSGTKFAPTMKAETAAIGRALAHAGYGTEFVDDEDDVVDAPGIARGTHTPPAGPVMLWRPYSAEMPPETLKAQMSEDLFLIQDQGTMEHMLSWRRHYAMAPAELKADLREMHNAISDQLEAKKGGPRS